jgi:plasmid stabilization system protein ParE
MNKFTVILSLRFKRNLNNIFDYIAADKLSAAIKFRQEIYAEISNLSEFPFMGGNPPENELQKENRKILYYGNYKIYYDINLPREIVEIKTIRHGARQSNAHA